MTSTNIDQNLDHDGQMMIASVGVRLMGVLYDGMLVLALLFLVSLVGVAVGTVLFGQVGTSGQDINQLPMWYQRFVQMPLFILTLVGFYGLFWRKSGQTLGMQTWRLKTIGFDGHLLGWQQSFNRVACASILPLVCYGVSMLFYHHYRAMTFSALFGFLLNYLFAFVQPKGLCLHDVLSRTLTIRIGKYQHITLWQTLKNKRSKN